MKIGNREFDTMVHTYIMGILNVTPDSFSDGGKWNSMDAALKHTEEMIAEGASVIDVGGESTRPGYEPISEEEEISRIVPIITQIKSEFDIPVSLDTYKSAVAEAGIRAGADMINDIWGSAVMIKWRRSLRTAALHAALCITAVKRLPARTAAFLWKRCLLICHKVWILPKKWALQEIKFCSIQSDSGKRMNRICICFMIWKNYMRLVIRCCSEHRESL